jgi:hypothetical protein
MLSLEPGAVTNRRYPLLFQTGETAFGTPLVDGQHPHDFVMELGMQYARPIGENGMWNLYYAPVGDPALGPVAFPHRTSAMELPQAALSHHWHDSTHIANNVLTGGITDAKRADGHRRQRDGVCDRFGPEAFLRRPPLGHQHVIRFRLKPGA